MIDLQYPPPSFDPRSPERWDADIPSPDRRRNMKVTILFRLEAMLMHTFMWAFRKLGVDRSSAFLGKLLRLVGPLLWPINGVGLRNLEMIYPEQSKAQNQAIMRDVWENLGRTVAEYSWLDRFFEPHDPPRVTFTNQERLQELIDENRPFIFVSGHFANWELMAPALFRAGLKSASIYRASNNALTDQFIIDLRARGMSRYQIPKGKEGSKEVVKALKDGYSMCLMMDQKLANGVLSDFLGRPAVTAPASARLSLKYKAPVVPMSIVRKEGAFFEITIHEPIEVTPSEDMSADVQEIVDRVNVELGNVVRANPGQWLWLHRRWLIRRKQD